MSAIELCRTAALGGHVESMRDCAHSRVAYNSCRNRHCPKCQGGARDRWLAAREADLLPVPYFHVVFTLPAEVAAIAFQNKAVVYAILFEAVAETLKTIAADPRHLGGEIGFIAILHTWGQTPHPSSAYPLPGSRRRHCQPDGRRWIRLPAALLPAGPCALPACSGGCSSNGSRRRTRPGGCASSARSHGLGDAGAFADAIRQLRRKTLGRLCQAAVRIARTCPRLSRPLHPPRRHRQQPPSPRRRHERNLPLARLPARQRTPADDARRATSSSAAFLLHSLPDGFHRIRHYGFLANGVPPNSGSAVIRQVLAKMPPQPAQAQRRSACFASAPHSIRLSVPVAAAPCASPPGYRRRHAGLIRHEHGPPPEIDSNGPTAPPLVDARGTCARLTVRGAIQCRQQARQALGDQLRASIARSLAAFLPSPLRRTSSVSPRQDETPHHKIP